MGCPNPSLTNDKGPYLDAYYDSHTIRARAGISVVFGHCRKDQYGRFGDGHLIRTSDVIKAEREGRFWVLTTVNSRYVLVTFPRGNGRSSLSEFQRFAVGLHHFTPWVAVIF